MAHLNLTPWSEITPIISSVASAEDKVQSSRESGRALPKTDALRHGSASARTPEPFWLALVCGGVFLFWIITKDLYYYNNIAMVPTNPHVSLKKKHHSSHTSSSSSTSRPLPFDTRHGDDSEDDRDGPGHPGLPTSAKEEEISGTPFAKNAGSILETIKEFGRPLPFPFRPSDWFILMPFWS